MLAAVAALAALAALAASWVAVEGQWRPRAGSQGDHRAGAQPYPGRIGTALPVRKAERNGVNRGLWFACALCIDGPFLAKGASHARLQLKLTLGAGRSLEFADGTFRRDIEVLQVWLNSSLHHRKKQLVVHRARWLLRISSSQFAASVMSWRTGPCARGVCVCSFPPACVCPQRNPSNFRCRPRSLIVG